MTRLLLLAALICAVIAALIAFGAVAPGHENPAVGWLALAAAVIVVADLTEPY